MIKSVSNHSTFKQIIASRPLYWAFQVLVLGTFFWYLSRIGFRSVINEVSLLHQGYFVIGICLILVVTLVRPWRSLGLLNSIGVPIAWWRLFRWSQEAWFLSLLTPGKVGDLYRAYRIETEYAVSGPGILSTLLERWIDLVFVLLFGLIGLVFQSDRDIIVLRSIAGVTLLIMVVLPGLIIKNSRVKTWIKQGVRLIPFQSVHQIINSTLSGLGASYHRLTSGALLRFTVISVYIWLCYILGFYYLFLSLGIQLEMLSFLSCLALVLIVQSLPLTLFGLGTRDAALIYYLGTYGFTSVDAVAMGLLFVITYLFSLVIASGFWFSRNIMCCE